MRLIVIKITIIMSLALAFGIAAPAAPQQSAEPTQQKQPGKQMMTMDEMMQECRKHCQETTKSIDQTTKMMDEAGQSNAPARMRAALDQAQKELVGMKNHMSMCMSMMDMMEKTHGKGQKKQ
jgi:DNA-binding ferritin-like protein